MAGTVLQSPVAAHGQSRCAELHITALSDRGPTPAPASSLPLAAHACHIPFFHGFKGHLSWTLHPSPVSAYLFLCVVCRTLLIFMCVRLRLIIFLGDVKDILLVKVVGVGCGHLIFRSLQRTHVTANAIKPISET